MYYIYFTQVKSGVLNRKFVHVEGVEPGVGSKQKLLCYFKPLPHLRDRARFTGSELAQKPKRCDFVVCGM